MNPAIPPAVSPSPPPSRWDRIVAVLPGITTLSQFLLVTLLGTFAKCSVDDYTRDMERIKQVSALNEALAERPEAQTGAKTVTKQNLSLVTLDRMLATSAKAWPLSLFYSRERQADDSLVFSIAEEVYRARLATQPSAGVDSTLLLGRLNVIGTIMRHRDPARCRLFLASVRKSATARVISSPNASTVLVRAAAAALPINPDNLPLVRAVADINNTDTIFKRLCYIQFRSYKRSDVQRLQRLLRKRKWVVPEPERIDGSYGCSVRYFYAADKDRALTVQQLAQPYLDSLSNKPKLQLLSLVDRKLPGVPHGQIEIWISSPGN